MYLLLITISLCIVYLGLFFVFPLFFMTPLVKLSKKSIVSLGIIALCSVAGYFIAFSISDPEVSNRILHGFGGGVMALLACFLAIKDSKVHVTKFQFFFISMLIVASLGVANEIMEFAVQHFTGAVFARNRYDTWYDLVSNTIGSSIAAIVFTPFISKL